MHIVGSCDGRLVGGSRAGAAGCVALSYLNQPRKRWASPKSAGEPQTSER